MSPDPQHRQSCPTFHRHRNLEQLDKRSTMTSPQHSNTSKDPTAGPQNYYGSADDSTSSYTRPPPAYAGDEEALLSGQARSSEDNVRLH
jgi:hypothetical protein